MDEPELRSFVVRRLDRRRLMGLDAMAALAYTFVLMGFTARKGPAALPLPLECLIVALSGLPLAVRRLWPAPVFGVTLTMSVLSIVLGMPGGWFLAPAFALYLVALTQPRRRWIPTSTIGVLSVVFLVFGASFGPRGWTAELFGTAIMAFAALGGAWTLGRALRERRAYARHSAAQLADRAVTDERIRIARELHDVVAHSMSLIVVKAGVANHVAEARPEEARDALRVIEATGRTALTEMRQLLGVLRTGTDYGFPQAGAPAHPPLTPASPPPTRNQTRPTNRNPPTPNRKKPTPPADHESPPPPTTDRKKPATPAANREGAPPPTTDRTQSATPAADREGLAPSATDGPGPTLGPADGEDPERSAADSQGPAASVADRERSVSTPSGSEGPAFPAADGEGPAASVADRERSASLASPREEAATPAADRNKPATSVADQRAAFLTADGQEPASRTTDREGAATPAGDRNKAAAPAAGSNPGIGAKARRGRRRAPKRDESSTQNLATPEPGILRPPRSADTSPFQAGLAGPSSEFWQDVPLAPAPGLAALPGLVDRAAMAGVRVELDLHAQALPEGVALSVYRIVQEALTNVVKHAAPARCQVSVWADEHEVWITVTDDGPGTRVLPGGPRPGEGHGLIGMRERVMMYGGDFSAGPRPGGGFAVSARLPYEPTTR
ncbi:histidine kinase [Spirillospora sp. NPDC048911]|uniref:histidine kinase n=1 Tax=Spirillospora sp. NPDC048911 TaxID=3364527 RepID=UPI003723ED02